MTRHLRTFLLVATVAVLAAACTGASVAAEVNGTAITDDDVLGIRTTEVGPVILGEGFRNDLTTLIIAQATIDAAAEDYGITGLDTAEAREEWTANASGEELGVIESVASNDGLTSDAVDVVTTQLMVRAAVLEALPRDPNVLMSIWEDQRAFLSMVCVKHILVASEEEAFAARTRIEAGEDFGTVADEVSLDRGAGGALPCPASPHTYVEPFATVVVTAPVGEITAPFETQYGWHVAVVESRDGPETFEEFAAEPTRWASEVIFNEVWTRWRDDALDRADVVVRSPIGRWFAAGDGVLPPPSSP